MGFAPDAVDLIGRLVRWHLLLSQAATTRDPEDPATVESLTSRLKTAEALDLLLALTEADAKATAPKAWSSWRSGLVRDLARRTRAALGAGGAVAPAHAEDLEIPPEVHHGSASVTVEDAADGSRVTVVAPDRVGLLADIAAVLALQRMPVRAARAWSQEQYGFSVWEVGEVGDHGLDAAVLRQRYEAVADGRVDTTRRLRPSGADAGLDPAVVVRPEASEQATVLEVRAADRLGVLHLVCAALAELDVAVRSAHVDTLGPQAVDVFYLQEPSAGALSDHRAAAAAHAVRAALTAAGGS
jgi:[protein-PII] uridylyltransferase